MCAHQSRRGGSFQPSSGTLNALWRPTMYPCALITGLSAETRALAIIAGEAEAAISSGSSVGDEMEPSLGISQQSSGTVNRIFGGAAPLPALSVESALLAREGVEARGGPALRSVDAVDADSCSSLSPMPAPSLGDDIAFAGSALGAFGGVREPRRAVPRGIIDGSSSGTKTTSGSGSWATLEPPGFFALGPRGLHSVHAAPAPAQQRKPTIANARIKVLACALSWSSVFTVSPTETSSSVVPLLVSVVVSSQLDSTPITEMVEVSTADTRIPSAKEGALSLRCLISNSINASSVTRSRSSNTSLAESVKIA